VFSFETKKIISSTTLETSDKKASHYYLISMFLDMGVSVFLLDFNLIFCPKEISDWKGAFLVTQGNYSGKYLLETMMCQILHGTLR
jgi:hypothetical protein